MCNEIIDTQIRAALLYKYTVEVASTGFSLSIEDAKVLLKRDTGIDEKDHNVRNTMLKLTKLRGFTFADNILRYESEKQKARREEAIREAELRSAEETFRKAQEHLDLVKRNRAA